MGKIEVIVGPMFSGKSEEVIRRIKRYMLANKEVIAFYHSIDTRFGLDKITTRNYQTVSAIPIESFRGLKYPLDDVDVIVIDEAQFFDEDIVGFSTYWRDKGKHLIISGLDMNVYGDPFGFVPDLMAVADTVTKLTAVCTECGADAIISYRISAEKDEVVVGDKDYVALCWDCYNKKHIKRESWE